MPTQAHVQQTAPGVLLELAGEERRHPAQFLRLAVHVVHELVDQGDGDLLHLRLRVRHLADQNVARGVNSGFGFGV